MKDLYDRLKRIGFGRRFVREHVLPDWWEDSLASVPANRSLAESYVARFFRFRIADVRNLSRRLSLPRAGNFRLKRSRNTTPSELRAAVLVAQRIAELVVGALPDVPEFRPLPPADAVRQHILAGASKVDLASLVNFCWDWGMPVLHLDPNELPKGKRFQGLAMFAGTTPAIVLAFGGDGPSRLAFHLAHEMGHVQAGNVRAGDKPIVDISIDQVDDDRQERSADRFAIEVLTGNPEFAFKATYGLTAPKLVKAAREFGRANAIDPATVALIYGHTANRFPAAQKALKLMGEDSGARGVVADALLARLDLADLPESTVRYLSCLSAVEA